MGSTRFKQNLGALCGVLCIASLAASSAKAADTIETGLIGAPNAVGWPWYIGMQKGFFTDAGINLDLIYVPTASGLVQQLSAGSLDIVADVGVVEPIHAVQKGAPVGLIRIVGQVSAYEMLAKPDIASIKDLKGKTICIGGLIDINRVYLERIMQANGLHDGDYDITVVGNTAGRFAALKSGAADATMLAPPVNFFAEDAGFHNVGMIMDYAGDLPFSGTDVSLAYVGAHRDTLVKLLAAVDKSVAWFDDDANRTEAIDILAQAMKSPRDPVERSYDYLRKINYFAPSNEISRKRMQNLIDAMKALGDIKSDITPDKVVVPGLTRLVD
ncbi:MAG TPA: ABC transporter substrate-binding protein [Xanthobacteraceae bacterium]|jgi:ABC-type nitrate/sulfonate/bicarbonate transport system substrate-binding protein|nr:ABC transporter substrate-binding protein [Xanthobacteraceae bacterium]